MDARSRVQRQEEGGSATSRKPLFADLSQDELFDPKFQKWITIGDGTWKEADDTWWAKTDVHWGDLLHPAEGKVTSR